MLMWSLIFFVIAVMAGLFGFTRVQSSAAAVAKVLFGLFLILFLGAIFLAFFAIA